MPALDETEIIVGTYEEFLLGYRVDKESFKSVQSFATRAHAGSVRCAAMGGKHLASGGADDKIIVHDMVDRTENRVLVHHDGTVNALAFAENGTHLFSGSSDGTMYVTRTSDWRTEKIWSKAHGGSPITAIAVHPSDKLALTIGEDDTLRTWNLVKGRKAFTVNLASRGIRRPLTVEWEPNGERFSLTGQNSVTVWNISDGAIESKIECPAKSICMTWINSDLAAIGLENGHILLHDSKSKENTTIEGHPARVRDIKYSDGFLYSASSDGHIKIWKLDEKNRSPKEMCVIGTGCRITCLTLAPILTGKVKTEEDDEKEEKTDPKKYDDTAKSFAPYVSIEVENEAKKLRKTQNVIDKSKKKLKYKCKRKLKTIKRV